jgi:SAM-dependent methyltransferase
MPLPTQLSSLADKLRRRAERLILATGRTVECPYCGWHGWRFLSAGEDRKPNRLCPGCGSLERYRILALLLERELAGRTSVQLLELAPKACLQRFCRTRRWGYLSSDLEDPKAMVHADLRAMPMATSSLDAIVCLHVMEHIIDDGPAFSEIARMLKPDGFAVICVPLGDDRTQEGAPRSEWTRLYGQYDHVRLYGLDIVERMQAAGLEVTTLDTHSHFDAGRLTRYGLRGDDRYFFIVRKRAS